LVEGNAKNSLKSEIPVVVGLLSAMPICQIAGHVPMQTGDVSITMCNIYYDAKRCMDVLNKKNLFRSLILK
jgi:hypothetical protein